MGPCLHDVEHAQLHIAAAFGVVDDSALDDDGVGGQIHTPRQRGGAHYTTRRRQRERDRERETERERESE